MAKRATKKVKKSDTFFLRFYGATKESIDACLEELRDLGHDIIEHSRGPATLSCNMFAPPNAMQVNVTFGESTLSDFKADDRARQVYMKYAAPGQNGTLAERKQGDAAFGV